MPDNLQVIAQLPGLLVDPHEALDIEIKGWIDIRNDNAHRALLAKAIIALGNHGGGHIIIGLEETANGYAEAVDRPASFNGYSVDSVNAVVNRYLEPPFHCDVQIVASPAGNLEFPIISVPGGHSTPIRSRRDSPDGTTLRANSYYIRRPGPQSEVPQSGQEWDQLIRRCLANAREDLIGQFRTIMAGGPVVFDVPSTESERAETWFEDSFNRWLELIDDLPIDHHARLPHGHYAVAYQLFSDELNHLTGRELLEAVRRGVVRNTGWPPFWVPTREGIAPYIENGNLECWLGKEGNLSDAAHSDYWRVSPEGQYFLIRGYQEDGDENDRTTPGQSFDLTLPTWRVGEILLHASSMARQLDAPEARVVALFQWTGLSGRELFSWANTSRYLVDRHVARQNEFRRTISARADSIPQNLPEILRDPINSLYELFDFFEIPEGLIAEELARMRQGRA